MRNKKRVLGLLSFLGVAALLAGCTSFFQEEETTTTEVSEETEITLDKASYETGEEVVVTYEIVEDLGENAWVGIVPADTVHDSEEEADAADTDYEYLEGSKTGSKALTAPLISGSYEVRIYSSDQTDAEELGYAAFTVVNSGVMLELDKTQYEPQATITVTFSGAADLESTAWVGVIPADVEHGDEATNDENDTSYVYLNGKESGTVTLVAPSEPGSYDVRLNESDSAVEAKELTYISFEVVE